MAEPSRPDRRGEPQPVQIRPSNVSVKFLICQRLPRDPASANRTLVTLVRSWPRGGWWVPSAQHVRADIAPAGRFGCYRPKSANRRSIGRSLNLRCGVLTESLQRSSVPRPTASRYHQHWPQDVRRLYHAASDHKGERRADGKRRRLMARSLNGYFRLAQVSTPGARACGRARVTADGGS